jgi:hypothetical protein
VETEEFDLKQRRPRKRQRKDGSEASRGKVEADQMQGAQNVEAMHSKRMYNVGVR